MEGNLGIIVLWINNWTNAEIYCTNHKTRPQEDWYYRCLLPSATVRDRLHLLALWTNEVIFLSVFYAFHTGKVVIQQARVTFHLVFSQIPHLVAPRTWFAKLVCSGSWRISGRCLLMIFGVRCPQWLQPPRVWPCTRCNSCMAWLFLPLVCVFFLLFFLCSISLSFYFLLLLLPFLFLCLPYHLNSFVTC